MQPPAIAFDKGSTNYNANNDLFTISATPLAIQLSSNPADLVYFIPGTTINIEIEVNDQGELVGGADNILIISGEIKLPEGDFTGNLLTCEITQFGYLDASTYTDNYEFVCQIISGQLGFLYDTGEVGIDVTSRKSTFNGGFYYDFYGKAKGTLGAIPAGCDLKLDKYCEVPEPVVSDDTCDIGKPVALVFKYTAEDCDASTNPQENKFVCSSVAGPLPEPVQIVMTKDADKINVNPEDESITIDPVFGLVTIERKDGTKFGAETKLDILQNGTALQSLNIHTSCSKKMTVGDQFGALQLVEFTAENGTVVGLPEPVTIDPTSTCEITSSSNIVCEDRPTTLSLKFNGGDCSQSINTQSNDKWSCTGYAGIGPVSVFALHSGKNDKVYLDSEGVQVGDDVVLDAATVGRSDLNGTYLSPNHLKIIKKAGLMIN